MVKIYQSHNCHNTYACAVVHGVFSQSKHMFVYLHGCALIFE
ncbi:hypothetical protein M7I_7067 [Glarea lozoyensis 74030]|uniref:Uncharacterized protein n=1 Tax=Glarea lozoyensis (strain ATCC 74030 / MF5533) TaxID=1104152 RepID=H0EWA4_GLAL7|nr:hypothetical protein M7I_7067 [Glarea lozoyensis 74030]